MSEMNTFTGKKFDPMHMTAENICAEDLAHALSLLCRGAGHIRHFYSVGQHSLNCMREAEARGWPKKLQLACLLHDASEAFLADVIRPVKPHLSNYMQIENAVMACVWEKFALADLTPAEHAQWRQVDDDILSFELHHLMPGEEKREIAALKTVPDVAERGYKAVEAAFLQALQEKLR